MSRLLVALLVMGLPLAAICVGMTALDWLHGRRARRLNTGVVVRLPLERRDQNVQTYRKARP